VLLELEHVAKQYEAPDGLAKVGVLRDVCLRVRQGESIAVIGPSGSGKSTLLNIMGTLDRPTSGTVRLKGRDLSDLSDRELSKLRSSDIGFVFQLHHLLPQCTVLENVLLPSIPAGNVQGSGQVAARARRLLQRVGLGSHLMHRPGQLSGGECQRAAVVRSLINSPGLLFADEPTGSLDRASSETLAELLVDINKEEGAGLIVVTHSMELASRMDRLFLLQDGVLNALESKS